MKLLKLLRLTNILLIVVIFSGLELFAEFKITSIGPNQKIGNSNQTFDKNWLCENTGTSSLSVTLSSNKSSRTPESWGLENISENFNLEAGGTQNCGIKLTAGKKGIGDAEVNLKTNEGFDRNILISYFTDEFEIINCNLSSLPFNQTNYNAYLITKQFDNVNFNTIDFTNILSQSTYSKTILVNKNNGDLDSTEAEILVNLFLSGKSLVISGADIFYKLSLTHPNHDIWSIFRFMVNEKIVNEKYNQDFGIEIIDSKNNSNNFFGDLLKLNRQNLENKPIRSLTPLISGAFNNYQNIYLAGTEEIIGYSAEFVGQNSITILNFDIEDIYNDFYINIIDDILDYKISSIEENVIKNGFEKNSLITFPNPITSITENIKIKFADLNISKIINENKNINHLNITNEIGQIININYEIINNEIIINTTNVQNGVYFVNIFIGENNYYSKFIINK